MYELVWLLLGAVVATAVLALARARHRRATPVAPLRERPRRTAPVPADSPPRTASTTNSASTAGTANSANSANSAEPVPGSGSGSASDARTPAPAPAAAERTDRAGPPAAPLPERDGEPDAEPEPTEPVAPPQAAAAPVPAAPHEPAGELERASEPPPRQPPPPPQAISLEARQLVLSLADELANLVSGVEGRAHNLIEAAPDRVQVPQAAEALVVAVQRLRTLHTKLLAFGHACARGAADASVGLPALMAHLRDELQHQQLGLELRWDESPLLAEIAVAPATVHDALSFLCAAMLRAERGATKLSVNSEMCFAGPTPRLRLELVLEWSAEASTLGIELLDDPTFTLDLEASNHLITSHGGELLMYHLPGRSVRAVVHWPVRARSFASDAAAATMPLPTALPPAAARAAGDGVHHYGGALVLEADPAVRAMLARELKATGRAVFACADGAAARSFLQATPDRFELLVVDHPRRLEPSDALARTIRELAPRLKIFVLAPAIDATPAWPGLHHIQKPFGVHELRAALASVLAAG